MGKKKSKTIRVRKKRMRTRGKTENRSPVLGLGDLLTALAKKKKKKFLIDFIPPPVSTATTPQVL